MFVGGGSSPHTRGAPPRPGPRGRGDRIIPAYAGSTFSRRRISGALPDHPRIRGEHQEASETSHSDRRIIPAYAGSTLRRSASDCPGSDHPRIRGEHLPVNGAFRSAPGSSPHTRGAPCRLSRLDALVLDHPRIRGEHFEHTDSALPLVRIIPAYAGSTRRSRSPRAKPADHPRIRGEHALRRFIDKGAQGSSPHTRGAPRAFAWCRHAYGIIPAYAGSTRRRIVGTSRDADHPRIRGEHPDAAECVPFADGSSPHTRGAPTPPRSRSRRPRIIPAYAGSTDDSGVTGFRASDHPRIRGEHELKAYVNRMRVGSSPHTRGAHPPTVRRCLHWRIIPAYAGSTAPRRPGRRPSWDHPRIRGEHSYCSLVDS